MESKYQYFPQLFACFSVVSCLASATVLVPLFSSRFLSSKTFTLLAGCISFGDFLKSIAYTVRFLALKSDNSCKIQAAIGMTFQLSAIFWMMRLTHFLYRIVVRRDRNIFVSRIDHCICWGIPLLAAFGPISTGWVALGNGRDWDKYREVYFPPTKKHVFQVLNMACSWQPTSKTPAWMFAEGMNPFVFYVLTTYICIFVIIIEMIIVIVAASRIATGDVRLTVQKFLSYPAAFMLSQVR